MVGTAVYHVTPRRTTSAQTSEREPAVLGRYALPPLARVASTCH